MARREYIRERDTYIVQVAEQLPWLSYKEIAQKAEATFNDPTIREETVRNALRAYRKRK